MIDIFIIGAGPSGLTAALYALRSGYNVLLLEKYMPGGQLLKTEKIDNYPGFINGISGNILANKIFKQISKFKNFIFKIGEATKIIKIKNKFNITIDSEYKIETTSIILATGGKPRNLGISSEKKFLGKGISYCAICDGFFFKNKIVSIIGGGNTAIEDAFYLSKIAKTVNLIHRKNNFKADKILVKNINKYLNINLYLNKKLISIKGTTKVNKIILKDIKTNKLLNLYTDAIFLAIGQTMNTDIVKNMLILTKNKHVSVNSKMSTSVSGLFACGDIIDKNLFQISTAIGEGATAGYEAINYINNMRGIQ